MSSFRLCKPRTRDFFKPSPHCTIKPFSLVFGTISTSPHITTGFIPTGSTWFHLKPSINKANSMIGLTVNLAAMSRWMICDPEMVKHFIEFEDDSCIQIKNFEKKNFLDKLLILFITSLPPPPPFPSIIPSVSIPACQK